MLGGKGIECFRYSAAYDDDAEFLRRYGAEGRPAQMRAIHGDNPAAADALTRLEKLTK